jgi:hypothetical protein
VLWRFVAVWTETFLYAMPCFFTTSAVFLTARNIHCHRFVGGEQEANIHYCGVGRRMEWSRKFYCGRVHIAFPEFSSASSSYKPLFFHVFPISFHFILNFLNSILLLSSFPSRPFFLVFSPLVILQPLCVLIYLVCYSLLLLFSH